MLLEPCRLEGLAVELELAVRGGQLMGLPVSKDSGTRLAGEVAKGVSP